MCGREGERECGGERDGKRVCVRDRECVGERGRQSVGEREIERECV